MRSGQVEATFAEFDFARFLYIHDIVFKFVTPIGMTGKDYDFGIVYADGREACADAKCRLEGTDIRADTVRNSLNKARTNNLPPDKPGIVFVKVPQTWLEQEEVRRGGYAVVEDFKFVREKPKYLNAAFRAKRGQMTFADPVSRKITKPTLK